MLTNLICRYELLVLASVVALTTPAAAQTLLIGAPPSRFEEMTPGKIKGIEADFPDMVKEFTGFDAKLARRTSVAETVAKLVDGTDQFAVLQGVEYAWMKEKNPQIEPLLTAIYRTARPKAMLLVLQDNSAKSFADLKGKTLGMLKGGKEHITVFANKGAEGDASKFFGKVVSGTKAEELLDDVLRKKLDAAIVDESSLDIYRDINPGRFARLSAIAESPLFPPIAIVYVPGKVSADIATRLKAGMLKANASERSQDTMRTFKITAFEPVPAGYASWVTEIGKAYPAAK